MSASITYTYAQYNYVPAAAQVSMTILVKSCEARPFCRITCSRFCTCGVLSRLF